MLQHHHKSGFFSNGVIIIILVLTWEQEISYYGIIIIQSSLFSPRPNMGTGNFMLSHVVAIIILLILTWEKEIFCYGIIKIQDRGTVSSILWHLHHSQGELCCLQTSAPALNHPCPNLEKDSLYHGVLRFRVLTQEEEILCQGIFISCSFILCIIAYQTDRHALFS